MTLADHLQSAAGRPALTWTASLVDVDVMSVHLGPLLAGLDATTDGVHVSVTSATIVGGKDGERVVVAYDTEIDHDRGPVLIGKAFADPAHARRLYTLLVDLSHTSFAGDHDRVPYPLAHLAEFGMVVYLAAPGRPLDRVEHSDRTACVADAARWLAVLHGVRVELPRRFDLPNEMRNLALWAELVVRAHPDASAVATQLVDRIHALADRARLNTGVRIHKDFHYGHTLFAESCVTVIDLDEARTGDAAFDVAHFAAYLRLLNLRDTTPADESQRLQAAFLDSYVVRTGYRIDARYELAYAYTCAKIAKQLVTGRGPTPVVTELECGRQVDAILREGLRCPGR